MIRQFIVTVMNLGGVREHKVNCTSVDSAKIITEGIFKDYRVIDVKEV